MAKIISATDYGNRKVVRVCMNPDDPESVHSDGAPHNGAPPAGTDPTLKSWEWCQDCTYNWQVLEFVWTGEELYKRSANGSRIPKSDTDLLNEVAAGLPIERSPVAITTLVNVDL